MAAELIAIRKVDRAQRKDLLLPNEPFPIYGRLIPSLSDGKWSYRETLYAESEKTTLCFPYENYDFDALSETHIFFGAYDKDTCVGLAVCEKTPFRYLSIPDLKVSAAYRRRGVGRALIAAALDEAVREGKLGLTLVAQDDNLAACRFYFRCGFTIGGFDNRIYRGTSQETKADLILYLDAKDFTRGGGKED